MQMFRQQANSRLVYFKKSIHAPQRHNLNLKGHIFRLFKYFPRKMCKTNPSTKTVLYIFIAIKLLLVKLRITDQMKNTNNKYNKV